MSKLNIVKSYSVSKVGLNEVKGLEESMRRVVAPIQELIQDKVYWHDGLEFEQSEYVRRDGFIPYASNCGGLELTVIVPKCEEHSFDFLTFGECDECGKEVNAAGELQCGYEGMECVADSEGHNDAKLRVWLKFEGIEEGKLNFRLYLGGGNGDAPYFRTKDEQTIFEASFQAKSLEEFEKAATKQVKKLLKLIK